MSSQFDIEWMLSVVSRLQQEMPSPTWPHIQALLRRMDGDEINLVSLEFVDNGALTAGGGNEGRYVVNYYPFEGTTTAPVQVLRLTDPAHTGPDVMLTVEKPRRFPAKYVVELPLVLKVFEQFFRNGRLPRSVRWEIDDTGIEANVRELLL